MLSWVVPAITGFMIWKAKVIDYVEVQVTEKPVQTILMGSLSAWLP